MEKDVKAIVNAIKFRICDEQFQNAHKTKPTDFVRTRKLSFASVMDFVLGLANSSCDFERIRFCDNSGIESLSSAALSKARDKISYTAFRALLNETQGLISSKKRYKCHRVIAVDGIKGDLPNTAQLRKHSGKNTGNYPRFHAVAMYDILNCTFLDAEIAMSAADERGLAYELLAKLQADNDILLFDRGFPSLKLIQILEELGLKYVARASRSFLREVDEFTAQTALDKTVQVNYTRERMATSRVKGAQAPYSCELRCVRIWLPEGEEEVLITNLPRETFKRKDIGQLYHLRWGVETSFNHLKNAVHVEEFVGIKENSVLQEFYSSLIKYNIIMQFVDLADYMEVCSKKNHKIGVQAKFPKGRGGNTDKDIRFSVQRQPSAQENDSSDGEADL